MDDSDKSGQLSASGQFLEKCDRLRPIRFDITEIYVEIFEDEGCGDVAENSTSQANCLIITISCLVGTNLDVGYEKF